MPLSFTDGIARSEGGLIFSAAAEDTLDPYQDGPCAGSIIGILVEGRMTQHVRVDPALKLEGIAIARNGTWARHYGSLRILTTATSAPRSTARRFRSASIWVPAADYMSAQAGGGMVSTIEETGTIDYVLIEAKGKEINGALVPPLLDLVDRRLIRILDVLVLVKRGEGDFDALTTSDLDARKVGDLGSLSGASSGLLSADDAAEAAAVLSAQQHRSPGRVREPVVHRLRDRRSKSRWPARWVWTHSNPGRRGGPGRSRSLRQEDAVGLVGGIARTAVIAGTATAVSNRVSRRQANRWAQQDQAAYAQAQPAPPPQYAQPQYAAPPPQYAAPPPQYAPPPPPAAPPQEDVYAQITKLAQLKNAGVLTEEEFAAKKAQLLGI